MKKITPPTIILFGLLLFSNCNKEKKMMNRLTANWDIEKSERAILYQDGTEEIYETVNNAGTLTIYEESENSSNESRSYDFFHVDANGDTISAQNMLVTDEKNKRIILQGALNQLGVQGDLVWTIEKSKKNRQEWSIYGIDSTFFYPANNNNPGGGSTTWLVWRIKLKKK